MCCFPALRSASAKQYVNLTVVCRVRVAWTLTLCEHDASETHWLMCPTQGNSHRAGGRQKRSRRLRARKLAQQLHEQTSDAGRLPDEPQWESVQEEIAPLPTGVHASPLVYAEAAVVVSEEKPQFEEDIRRLLEIHVAAKLKMIKRKAETFPPSLRRLDVIREDEEVASSPVDMNIYEDVEYIGFVSWNLHFHFQWGLNVFIKLQTMCTLRHWLLWWWCYTVYRVDNIANNNVHGIIVIEEIKLMRSLWQFFSTDFFMIFFSKRLAFLSWFQQRNPLVAMITPMIWIFELNIDLWE